MYYYRQGYMKYGKGENDDFWQSRMQCVRYNSAPLLIGLVYTNLS